MSLMVCNAKYNVTSGTTPLKVSASPSKLNATPPRYILPFAESQRLRGLLLAYVQTNGDCWENPTLIRLAKVAAEFRRLILTEQELRYLELRLDFTATSKEQI
jgi:hypothetical protein